MDLELGEYSLSGASGARKEGPLLIPAGWNDSVVAGFALSLMGSILFAFGQIASFAGTSASVLTGLVVRVGS